MIESTSFLGIPLCTRAHRRRIVVGYYVLLFALLLFELAFSRWISLALLVQSLMLGGLFGGIKRDGPIKSYEGSRGEAISSPILTLDLEGSTKKSRTLVPLDEREAAERDHAHYLAYKVLRIVLAVSAFAVYLAHDLMRSWLADKSVLLLWMLVIVILSLPQSVILWTESTLTDSYEVGVVEGRSLLS